MSIRHFLTTQDYTRPELDELLAQAARYKRDKLGRELAGRAVALLFFNSSMRTRSSFEIGTWQLGGHAAQQAVGGGVAPKNEVRGGNVLLGDLELVGL